MLSCSRCGESKPEGEFSPQPMQPLSRGGLHQLDNVIPACRSCNSRKHDWTLLEFAAKTGAAA